MMGKKVEDHFSKILWSLITGSVADCHKNRLLTENTEEIPQETFNCSTDVIL